MKNDWNPLFSMEKYSIWFIWLLLLLFFFVYFAPSAYQAEVISNKKCKTISTYFVGFFCTDLYILHRVWSPLNNNLRELSFFSRIAVVFFCYVCCFCDNIMNCHHTTAHQHFTFFFSSREWTEKNRRSVEPMQSEKGERWRAHFCLVNENDL